MMKEKTGSKRTSKSLYRNFQYVVNNAIDNEDIKELLIYGIKYVLLKNRYFIYAMAAGLILMLLGFQHLSFIGLVVFLIGLVYVGVEMVQFVSGDDKETFNEIKEDAGIQQSSLIDYVDITINKKKKVY
ncbi:hypothetical protein [Virgibacillus halodenitrificans]|uniref:hypothetical protein n=1 Tax=Virgibacillus halodenitrificans TaxID=1482 RepID=UPI000EF51DD1|nr:hypothetical protein [Virgibacillus halodenitrificans]